MLLCFFAGYEFPGVVMMSGTRYVYGFFLCVSFVWCGGNVWIFIVGCQSRMGGGWSLSMKGLLQLGQPSIQIFLVVWCV